MRYGYERLTPRAVARIAELLAKYDHLEIADVAETFGVSERTIISIRGGQHRFQVMDRIDDIDSDGVPRYLPTPEEIEIEKAKIRSANLKRMADSTCNRQHPRTTPPPSIREVRSKDLGGR